MNKVIFGCPDKTEGSYKLRELCPAHEASMLNFKTAFIGSIGTIDSDLFLVTFNRIILAREPHQSWSNVDSTFSVQRFVDIEIKVMER